MSLDVNISEPDEFNCIELHNCIKSVAEIYKIPEFTYHVDILCGKGEHYVANVFRVSIKDSNSDESVSVVVKTLINTTRQELFRELHKREVNAYNNIIDKFVKIQNDIDENERIILPKCIFADITKSNEVIILEDLLLNRFVIDSKFAKYENIDYDQVRLIIEGLAKFHALSIVFKDKESNDFDGIKNEFQDLIYQQYFLDKTKLRNYFQESFEMSVNLISDSEIKNKLENVKDKLLELLRMYTEAKTFNVFCHGDCWINNILFKNEGNKKQICFLDFQAMRYASPVTDILYFLYLCTDSKFRSEHLEDLKIIYYNTFQSFLKLFHIEACTAYTKEEFENDLKEMLPFGLVIALIELRIVTTSPEEMVLNDHTTESGDMKPLLSCGGDKLYKLRVNDVITESAKNGVLDKLLDLVNSI